MNRSTRSSTPRTSGSRRPWVLPLLACSALLLLAETSSAQSYRLLIDPDRSTVVAGSPLTVRIFLEVDASPATLPASEVTYTFNAPATGLGPAPTVVVWPNSPPFCASGPPTQTLSTAGNNHSLTVTMASGCSMPGLECWEIARVTYNVPALSPRHGDATAGTMFTLTGTGVVDFTATPQTHTVVQPQPLKLFPLSSVEVIDNVAPDIHPAIGIICITTPIAIPGGGGATFVGEVHRDTPVITRGSVCDPTLFHLRDSFRITNATIVNPSSLPISHTVVFASGRYPSPPGNTGRVEAQITAHFNCTSCAGTLHPSSSIELQVLADTFYPFAFPPGTPVIASVGPLASSPTPQIVTGPIEELCGDYPNCPGQIELQVSYAMGPTSTIDLPGSLDAALDFALPAAELIRGDANTDGLVDIADGIFILNHLFGAGPAPSCETAADVNDDAAVNIADALYVFTFFFQGGASPPSPFPTCGADPTPDGLECASYSACP